MPAKASLYDEQSAAYRVFPWAREPSWLVLASALAIACDTDRAPPTALEKPIDVRTFVVGKAAESLDANGFFVLGVPASGIVTPERAAQLAIANVRMFGPTDRPYLERQFGAAIDFAALAADPRVYYAESPYEQELPSEFHPAFRKVIGPYYLVSLGLGGEPVLSVAVSAYNTDVDIVNGLLRFPVRHGADFRVQGVSVSGGTSVPVSPEHAVRIVAELSDARVSAVPELILPGRGFVPQYARWRIQLERPVTLRGEQTGRAYVGSELYVGLRGQVSVAAEAQPPGSLISDPDIRRSVTVARRANLPLEFEPVGR